MPIELDLEAAKRLGPTLALVGRTLRKAGYGERAVCSWFGTPLVSDARFIAAPAPRVRRGLGAWIALWMEGAAVERGSLGLLDGTALAALIAVGLVELDGNRMRARASLVPVRNVLVAADRLDDHDPRAVGSPDLSAWNLIASLPPRPASLLDVGTGAGVASLVAAQAGARAIGTDLDGRALAFACVNAFLNDVSAVFCEGDLYAGVSGEFAALCFNAPLLRAPLAASDDAPRYSRAAQGETPALAFLEGARARTVRGGEVLCHVQLTPAVSAAARSAGFSRGLEVHFADAVDGTPHGMISLRDGEPGYFARVRVPLGAPLRHLHREVIDRLHATFELSTDEPALRAAVLRPPPWLALTRIATHDGAAFRQRELRLGAHPLDAEDLALLEAASGAPTAAVAPDPERWTRLARLVERGLLVV